MYYAKTPVQWHPHYHTKIKYVTIKQLENSYCGQMKHILTMKISKHTKLSYFQNFKSPTFLDNMLLEKKSRRQFIFLCTPGSAHLKNKQVIKREREGGGMGVINSGLFLCFLWLL